MWRVAKARYPSGWSFGIVNDKGYHLPERAVNKKCKHMGIYITRYEKDAQIVANALNQEEICETH